MVVIEQEWNKIEARLMRKASNPNDTEEGEKIVFDKKAGGFTGGAQPFIEPASEFAQRTSRPLATSELRDRLAEISTQVDD